MKRALFRTDKIFNRDLRILDVTYPWHAAPVDGHIFARRVAGCL